jgi:hypothetical protein
LECQHCPPGIQEKKWGNQGIRKRYPESKQEHNPNYRGQLYPGYALQCIAKIFHAQFHFQPEPRRDQYPKSGKPAITPEYSKANGSIQGQSRNSPGSKIESIKKPQVLRLYDFKAKVFFEANVELFSSPAVINMRSPHG